MSFRVIQWATGGVGRAALEGILDHPELELVGCYVHDPAKAGRDAAQLVGRAPCGVVTTNDAEAIVASEADCVLYSPRIASPKEVARLLESGKNVVTPLGWFYPWQSTNVATLEAACRRGAATLH